MPEMENHLVSNGGSTFAKRLTKKTPEARASEVLRQMLQTQGYAPKIRRRHTSRCG